MPVYNNKTFYATNRQAKMQLYAHIEKRVFQEQSNSAHTDIFIAVLPV